MADGKWVNIPGKGRRWQQPSGELMMTQPGFGRGQFFQTQLANIGSAVRNLLATDPSSYAAFRKASAATLTPQSSSYSSERAPTDAELSAQGYGFGVHENDPFEQRSAGRAPAAPVLPPYAGATPAGARGIVQGVTSGGQVDRTQSDLYKQYALNPQGQFDRYFGGSQMDQYFGAASRGAGAPKTLEEMTALASQMKASTNVPLADYYRAQSAAGRGNMPEIVEGLTQGLDTQKANAMKQWAQANPMLAMREFNKRFPSGQPTMGSGEPSVAQSLQGTQYQGVGGQGFDSFAANSVPGPWNQQGTMVDLNRGAPFLRAAQAEKTNPQNALSQMPIGDRTKEFLGALGILEE